MSFRRDTVERLHELPSPKLRLDGTPTPRSWVARMTKRPAPAGVRQERLPRGARSLGIFMSEIFWNLSGIDGQCASYAPGHLVHWGRHKLSMRQPGRVVPVTVSVDDDGMLLLEGDALLLVGWNHRPALVRAALRRSGGFAWWKPCWDVIAAPTGHLLGGARNVFSVATPHDRRDCWVPRTTNPDHLVPSAPSPTTVPPLRIAARYAAGRKPDCGPHSLLGFPFWPGISTTSSVSRDCRIVD
jgi:hypothetical protein